MENISEFFYEKLKSSTAPGVVLLQFYSAVTETTGGRSEIIKINKLVKLFGRFSVFFAIMGLANSKLDLGIDEKFPMGLLFKICKDELERKSHDDASMISSRDLSRDIDALQKEIDKVTEVVVDESIYKELE